MGCEMLPWEAARRWPNVLRKERVEVERVRETPRSTLLTRPSSEVVCLGDEGVSGVQLMDKLALLMVGSRGSEMF